MFLQESSSAKNKRLVRKVIYRFFMITFTAMLYALDTYILFGTGLASISTDSKVVTDSSRMINIMNVAVNKNNVIINNNDTIITGSTVSFGPLFTSICTGKKCSRVLFYQVPDDKYFGESLSNILLATWIPLLIGLLGTRAMMYRVHPFIQAVVSFGYIGMIYLLATSQYDPGNTLFVIYARMAISVVFSIIVIISTAVRMTVIKFCPDIKDSPVLVGMSWNEINTTDIVGEELDRDYSDDLTSQRFYNPKKFSPDFSSDSEGN